LRVPIPPWGGAEQASRTSTAETIRSIPQAQSRPDSCITAPVRNAQSTCQASTAFQPPPRRLRYPPGRQREQCVLPSPTPLLLPREDLLAASETTAPIVPVLWVLGRRGRPFAARIPAVPCREPLPGLPRLMAILWPPSPPSHPLVVAVVVPSCLVKTGSTKLIATNGSQIRPRPPSSKSRKRRKPRRNSTTSPRTGRRGPRMSAPPPDPPSPSPPRVPSTRPCLERRSTRSPCPRSRPTSNTTNYPRG
jgi:hypothetical protein